MDKQLFYKPLVEHGQDRDFLFWGCLHYGHDPAWDVPIWKTRGYDSSEEHDAGIIEHWAHKANQKTVGYLLGDTVFGYGAYERLKRLLNSLIFHKLYIMSGNHQAGWKQLFEESETGEYVVEHGGRVIFTPNYLEVMINGQPIVLSHYPILSWNGQGKGSWMLFSHVHGGLVRSEIGRMYLSHGYNKEVSLEMCPYPVTFGDIRAYMRGRDRFVPDNHDENASTPFSPKEPKNEKVFH